jgi:hypothetical protein
MVLFIDLDAAKAQLIERSQALKNASIKGRTARRPKILEETLEVAQSVSMSLADRRRAPLRTSLLALRDSPSSSGSSNDACAGADAETRDCQIGLLLTPFSLNQNIYLIQIQFKVLVARGRIGVSCESKFSKNNTIFKDHGLIVLIDVMLMEAKKSVVELVKSK